MRTDSKNRIAVSSTGRAPAPSAESLENAQDLASPCASKDNSSFKENININKSGGRNLSLEPQQMKKKKGGKNNLRKSLAWDRAFFTEEGVLDPLELSVISGVSCRGGLPFISEDNSVSSSHDEDFHKDKRNNLSSPKFGLSSSNRMTWTSLASHGVPTTAGSKSGSKYSDCPRPLPSPSLKRWINANVGKTTSKDSNQPKIPGLKPGLSPTCATTRSNILRGSHVKHTQITQPDFSIQRDAEMTSSCKIQKNTEKTSRANTPQSTCYSDEKLGCSPFNRHLTFGVSPMTIDKRNNLAQKIIPVNVTQIRPDNTCGSRQYDSATFDASCSQNAQISGGNLHPPKNQTVKPSGLRMPSPSLSFFSQPKPSVFRNLPLRDTDSHFIGSRNHGSWRSQEKSSSTTKLCDKIPDSRISSSKAICSSSEPTASSHVSISNIVKPTLEQDPMHEVRLEVKSDVLNCHPLRDKIFEDKDNVFEESQGSHKKNIIMRVSHEEPKLQRIGIEVTSQIGSCGQAMESSIENSMDDCLVKSESRGSDQSQSADQSAAILESRRLNTIDGRHEIDNKCNLLVLDHSSTQCAYGSDGRVQNTPEVHSDLRKSSKRDGYEAQLDEIDPLKYSLRENDERTDKNITNETERASGQLDVYQQNGIHCSESMKALEQEKAMAESPYFVSKKLNAIEVSSDNLPAAKPLEQNSVFASTGEGSKYDTNILSEVGDDINQPRESPDVQGFHKSFEMESKEIGELNVKGRLSAEKRFSLQNSKQENKIYELPLVVSDRKGQENVIEPKIPSSLSLGKRHNSSLGEETAVAPPLRMGECNSVVNSFSSESCNSPISTISDCDAGTFYGNLSGCLHQVTQSIDVNDCPLPESKMRKLSPEYTLRKREEVPQIQVTSVDNELTPTMSLENRDYEIHNHVQESECLSLAGDEFVAENLVCIDDCMQAKHLPDSCSSVNAVGGTDDSVTSQHEILQSISRSSTSPRESPFKHETCDVEYENEGGIADAISDPLRVESFSNSIEAEVSEESNNFLSCIPPMLELDKVETEWLPKLGSNKCEDGIEEKKNLLVVIPPNAVPFSDEWLAAMEAAGEDILTRKSGKVQNSPPDKPLPEPSPWSPVKRKNNHITPFDCTKFTAPSDS